MSSAWLNVRRSAETCLAAYRRSSGGHGRPPYWRADLTDRQSGREFAADLPLRAYVYDRAGRTVYHYMKQRSDEHYYGFGEVVGPLDKRKARIRLSNVDAAVYDATSTEPLYKHIPFYITYLPDQNVAYGLFTTTWPPRPLTWVAS
ncbi:MAG: hypothetical protein IPK19_21665 [Chloroflexi bacterium]|nr:hypothetical protein [Chloroflexota bacterium]